MSINYGKRKYPKLHNILPLLFKRALAIFFNNLRLHVYNLLAFYNGEVKHGSQEHSKNASRV
jgi:hypothetical protein